ncbi:hypothetical protein DFR50_10839 [Roseiarcus fermentans]|uniref:Uncharacterized protein n=1 Tax=Roseiarcus fermentans TaxID=1473586 RepID=A0A366FLA7_9HYPH|nr:hypothetical protein [Roseiarcus fermentans]RBP15483.1 hypothetical protein DFR50_10839 [Roseiarcus fermentans]
MKKPAAKPRKPAAKSRKKRAGPLDTMFSGVDMDALRLLMESLPVEDRSVADMIEPFLSADPTSVEEMPEGEAISELAEELDRLRVDANGGDPRARAALSRARGMIDEAAAQDAIHPGILMILGRAFEGAHVDIGDAARASMGRMVAHGVLREPGDEAYRDLLNNLVADDFTLHEEIRCLSAIFPADYRARLVEGFAADADEAARRSAVGFLLDPDDTTALAALRGLAAAAAGGGLDAVARRRIALIRPWLTAARRDAVDRAFPADLAAGAPVSASIVGASASACDGSGASSLIATVKRGARFDVVAVMAKPSGVADSYVMEKLTRKEVEAVQQGARGATPSADTPLEPWLRLVRLALGRNRAGDTPPPFEFVRAVEALGLGALVPDETTPADIIGSLLADFPDRDDPAAIEQAHESVLEMDAADNWFEAGEAVEAVLRPAADIGAGARALLEHHLPKRRAFWASQCALTALALKEATRPEPWRELALVGRDVLGDAPLSDIPLMVQIAERSAAAFFAYGA